MPNTREKLIDRLPVDDAILILREELKQMVDGYATHLSYGGKGDPAEEVHIDALEMAISALEQTKWIPVTERLPDKNGEYLCRHTDKSVHSAEYESTYGSFGYWFDFWEDEYKEWVAYEGVTHWMPLPEPPKGE